MNARVQTSVFSPAPGATAEYHVVINATTPASTFRDQMDAVLKAYDGAAEGRTVHFRRFFLSDAANQFPLLQEALSTRPKVPTSIVRQAPLDGTRIALWMYCTAPFPTRDGVPAHNGYTHHWAGSLVSPGADSRAQMTGIFRDLDANLARQGLSVARDTIRTWIFSRDVDTNYAGVVTGRKDYFDRIGLTPDTHFIASTGIEGCAPDWQNIVEMDAYTVGGLLEGQILFLQATDHLNPTYEYGVTFERGTAVTYGDRRHVFISGTASIDAHGDVLYPGDAAAQTRRALENIAALLSATKARLDDLAMAIVYLRDPADYAAVRATVEATCPSLHALYVHAPVCRPAWLVEIEGIAATAGGDKRFADY